MTKVGDDALAMADRHEYLARILRVLSGNRVDGVMATMDILDDLLIVDGLLREAGASRCSTASSPSPASTGAGWPAPRGS